MVSDAQGVKAEIARTANEKMSELSNQYHRLVGTTVLEGCTLLLFSPDFGKSTMAHPIVSNLIALNHSMPGLERGIIRMGMVGERYFFII